MFTALQVFALLFTGALLAWLAARRFALRRERHVAAIRAYVFPAPVQQKFAAARAALDSPGLDAAARLQVFEALRDYFVICVRARGRAVAMPSQAADDAWHVFILHTRHYADFCRSALGRFLHHTPVEAMPSPTTASAGIRRAWRLCCELEGIDPHQPARLPRLFALDAALGIAGGFRYSLHCTPGAGDYCASHIGCGAGCGSDGGDGGGCGGD